MKTNVGFGVLLFCCGIAFAFLFLQSDETKRKGNEKAICVPPVSRDFTRKIRGSQDRATRRQGNTSPESTGTGHDSGAGCNADTTLKSNTMPKGRILHSRSSVRSEQVITRDRHATRAAYVPVTRERTIEKTATSNHIIDRLKVVESDDDNPLEEAASAKIADPVNPKPGMLFSAYDFPERMGREQLRESHAILPKNPALETGVDAGDAFSSGHTADGEPTVVRWEGFLKCKRTATYTFTIDNGEGAGWENGYSVCVNSDLTVTGYGYNAFDADLKVGWNKVEIVCQSGDGTLFSMAAKRKGSVVEPVKLSPGTFFYDDRPELKESRGQF